MNTKNRIITILAIGIFLIAVSNPHPMVGVAQVSLPDGRNIPNPVTIPYPGRLNGADGQPVTDGAYAFAFDLFTTETGGQSLWSEVQEGVALKEGGFTTALGSVNPIPVALLDGRDLWLSISVRGPGEAEFAALTPRQRVSASSPTAPSDVSTLGTCPHDHVGEVWSAAIAWSGAGFRVNNSANGPSIWGWNTGEGNGVRGDSWGNGIGVYGEGENGPGVVGRSSTGYGVEGVTGDSGSGGVWAHSVNGYGLFAHSDNSHSIYVDGAGNNGVYVASAGGDGVGVASAAMSGIYVQSAGLHGVEVETATLDGVHVIGPVGGNYYGSGKKGAEDFAVLNTGEVRSKVGFATPAQDYAVMMSFQGAKSDYEPGDVLVIRADQDSIAGLGSGSYSTAVIGVYTESPGFLGGQSVTSPADGLPVAVMGIVSVKVSAENGPIHPGDLLVTSSTPGYAMRGEDPQPGTILGKALGSLDSGSGVILVLLTLQ